MGARWPADHEAPSWLEPCEETESGRALGPGWRATTYRGCEPCEETESARELPAGGGAAARPGRPLPLLLVICEKAASALGLAIAAVLAFVLRGRGVDPLRLLFAGELAEDPHDRLVHWLGSLLPRLTSQLGLELAIGLLLWAALFAAEAAGLWRRRVWAEALVIVETASFLPVEVWDLLRRPQLAGWLSLAINLSVLVYVSLLYRRRRWQRA